jgi:hypothetical protein
LVARTPEEAIDGLLARLRPVAGCVTDRPLAARRVRGTDRTFALGFDPAHVPVVLRSESRRRTIHLFAIIEVQVSAATASADLYLEERTYIYSLHDTSQHELVSWHLHQLSSSDVTYLHSHVSSRIGPLELGRGLDPLPLADLHIPTGFVDLADIVRFLIAEAGIRPRKSDWQTVLN